MAKEIIWDHVRPSKKMIISALTVKCGKNKRELDNQDKQIANLKAQVKKLTKNGSFSDGYHTFDELYEHRAVLYIALCRAAESYGESVWMSKTHSDGEMWSDWFLLGISLAQEEQITYHMPIKYWDVCYEFAIELEQAPEFDGHTSKDVLDRIAKLRIY